MKHKSIRSILSKQYKIHVEKFAEISERVIRNKMEMSYLWKYKKDYPEDWKRKADMLSEDRLMIRLIRQNIREIKREIRQCDYETSKS